MCNVLSIIDFIIYNLYFCRYADVNILSYNIDIVLWIFYFYYYYYQFDSYSICVCANGMLFLI